MSRVAALVAAERRCFRTMEQCQRRKSPLSPLCQRGVKKKLQDFAWSRRIDGLLFTRRVRTTLVGNDELFEGGDEEGVLVSPFDSAQDMLSRA